MDKALAIKLRKNKIDLKHKVLLQNQQVVLAFGIGFPLTVANLVLSLNLLANRDIMLMIIAMVAICLGIMSWFVEKNNEKIKDTQNEIDQLLHETMA